MTDWIGVDVSDRTCGTPSCDREVLARGLCKKHYDNAYTKALRARRRSEWIASQGGVCVKCGSSDRLEIDHVDPASKEIESSRVWDRRAEVRDRELAKCQVLCKPCHEAKNATEQPAQHGRNGYVRGCRCKTCRDGMAASIRKNKAWRAARASLTR